VLLNQPYPQLRFVMGMHFTTPLAQEAVERYGDDFAVRHPVGCGPYQVQELKIRDRLILTKNPNCHWALYPTGHEPGDDPKLLQIGPKPLPLTLKLEFIGIQEPLTSYNLFRQGYIDSISAGYSNAQIIRGATGLTPEMKADGMSLVQALWCGYFYLGFNMMDATFGGYTQSKRKLREAISLSIDTDAYIQVVCQGLGKPANFCLPPGLFGYDPNYRNPYRQFDPSLKEAKRLLTEAGFPNGIDPSTGRKLVLHFDNYSTTPTLRQMVRLFQIQIERLGIRVELRDTTYDVYKARLNKHQTQFYFGSWIADYPDPENFLTTMYGPNAAPGPNETNYSNKTYDALFERMRAMRDTPERLALVHKLRDIAVPDCPLIPLSFGESRDIFPPWISNAQPHPIANDALLYWKVNPALRAKDQAEWNRPRVWPVAILGIAIIALALPGTTAILHRRRRKVRRG
jgi:oligopeptide transport system substrate-binding protein